MRLNWLKKSPSVSVMYTFVTFFFWDDKLTDTIVKGTTRVCRLTNVTEDDGFTNDFKETLGIKTEINQLCERNIYSNIYIY